MHHEPLPQAIAPTTASAIEIYSLPEKRKEYLPRLRQSVKRRNDGSVEIVRREYSDGSRGDFFHGPDGAFQFPVPFTEGEGVYTVVVWVRRPGFEQAVAVSNVSIRVDGALQSPVRASAGGR